MIWRRPLLAGAALLLVAPAPTPPDLDVGIPPGSPVSWGRRYPSITPRSGPLFPTTPSGAAKSKLPPGKKGQPGTGKDSRTVAGTATVEMDVNISTSFGVVRILTWDLAGHLTWVARTPRSLKGPLTGASSIGKPVKLPYVNDGLYWANMASLLRWMLHPQLVSEKELIAHLVEIGEPLLAVLDNSVSEKSLVAPSEKIRKMVERPAGKAGALPGKTPRETMLKRFLAEELVKVYPYDPEGGFGSRFFLFADEVEPYLIDYAEKHGGSFVKRNAVSAVGRYRSQKAMAALAKIAVKTRDPVVLMRCLAALGAYRSLPARGPLLSRMMEVKDPVEKIAFIVAAGRMGMTEAVPYLLKLASRARDADQLQAVLAALVRIPHAADDKEIAKFAKKIVKLAGTRPERYRVKTKNAPKPDFPDGPKTRGEVIHQLALLLQARAGGKERDGARQKVLGLVTPSGGARPGRPGARPGAPGGRPAGGPAGGPAGRRMPRRTNAYANTSMRRVHPPVQLLFLETLRLLGEPGRKALVTIARDTSVEPALRGHAMSQLPLSDRGAIAVDILSGGAGNIEAKIYAIEIIANDGHDKLQKIGKKILADAGKASLRASAPENRYLFQQALRALSRRGLLETEDLLDLMKYPEARKLTNEARKQRLRNQIEALVNDAAAGLPQKATWQRIGELVDQVIESGLNRSITTAKRKEHMTHVLKRLKGLKGHRADTRFKSMMAQELVTNLLGFKMGMHLRDRAQFEPVVLFSEELLLALGRTKTKKAGDALLEFLKERPDSPLRAHAALALGLVGKLDYAKHLVPLLRDPNGFTRFCAYESLRHLTKREFFADWMYSEAASRNLVAEQYEKLVGK